MIASGSTRQGKQIGNGHQYRLVCSAGVRLLALFATALLLAGCIAKQRLKMYAGPDLPVTQTALVTGQFKRPGWLPTQKAFFVLLVSIDGTSVPQGHLVHETEAIVTPGVHTVEVRFWGQIDHPDDPDQILGYTVESKKSLRVTFATEAAREYEIRVARAPNQAPLPWYGGEQLWIASVVDRQTGTPVPLLGTAGEAK